MKNNTVIVFEDAKIIELFKGKTESQVEEYAWENLLHPEKAKIFSLSEDISSLKSKYPDFRIKENKMK